MSKNPKHRPALVGRIESMARSFSTVRCDARIMDKGDIIELYENAPTLNITYQRCFELLIMWSRAVSIDDIPELNDDERQYLDWYDEVFDARRKLDSKPRDNKMTAYATAATLFNHQLDFDHKQGLRLNEKPTTAGAIQRTLNRPSGIEALARFEEFCKTNGFTSV